MYADRFTGRSRFHPAGLVAAIGINAAVVAALMLAAPHMGIGDPPEGSIEIYQVPPDRPPPEPQPLPKKAQSTAPAAERIETVTPLVDTLPSTDRPVGLDPLPFPTLDLGGGSAAGTGTAPADPPAPAPVIVGPSVDPRYAGDLQPSYPPSEQRLGRDGRVTVRVLVGSDGRVRQVERVSATSDAFFAVTQAQALRRWRFRPGTRDGVAQEAWRTITVTFTLED
ncbi:energy transducer TonB [Sphingomonas rubra]|uniref:Protein TonB n=1 Tax=Sphingomonas rubra TaxID=634430 RepID=A0A1I5RBF2_9SPHN|nr:energy transducer TonB [Sphingomonas rubra]SFP55852.1 protein TonB [Sphingomonas rubra]